MITNLISATFWQIIVIIVMQIVNSIESRKGIHFLGLEGLEL